MVFTASLLSAQQNRNSVEDKPASLLVSLGKTLNVIPPSLQAGGGAKQSIRRGGPSLAEDLQTEHERERSVYTSSCIILKQIAQTTKKKNV